MTKRVFTLVGPFAGKTVELGGYNFIDGTLTFEGSDADILIITKVLRTQYQAFGPDELEAAQKAYDENQAEAALIEKPKTSANIETDFKQKVIAERLISEKLDPKILYGKGKLADQVQANIDAIKNKKLEEEQTKEPVEPVEPTNTGKTVADALKELDPNDDTQWTARGIPSIDAITKILGRDVSRTEIEKIDPNYTRSVAKATRDAENK